MFFYPSPCRNKAAFWERSWSSAWASVPPVEDRLTPYCLLNIAENEGSFQVVVIIKLLKIPAFSNTGLRQTRFELFWSLILS
jgi:hypothetical protein